jgi:hypothetical protein
MKNIEFPNLHNHWMNISDNKMKETTDDMRKMAKSTTLQVEVVNGFVLYAYGTELETLRLFAEHLAYGEYENIKKKFRVGYLENLKTHYFKIYLCP